MRNLENNEVNDDIIIISNFATYDIMWNACCMSYLSVAKYFTTEK